LTHTDTMRSIGPMRKLKLDSQDDLVVAITSCCEFKPWKKPELVAAAAASANCHGLPPCIAMNHYFVIWSWSTGTLLHKVERDHCILDMKFESSVFVVVLKRGRERRIIEVFSRCNYELLQRFEHSDCTKHFFNEDKIFVLCWPADGRSLVHRYEEQAELLQRSEHLVDRKCPRAAVESFGNVIGGEVRRPDGSLQFVLREVLSSTNNNLRRKKTVAFDLEVEEDLAVAVGMRWTNNSLQIRSDFYSPSPAKSVHVWTSPIEDLLSASGQSHLRYESKRMDLTYREQSVAAMPGHFDYRYDVVPSPAWYIVTEAVPDQNVVPVGREQPLVPPPPVKISVIDLRCRAIVPPSPR